MKFVAITVGIIVALAFVGVFAHRFLKPRNNVFSGFRDWVKNPEYKQAAADHFAAREALETPDDLSDVKIQKMVDGLFVRKDKNFNIDRLKRVGVRAVPMLVAAIENPKTASTKFGNSGHAFDNKSPFERIVDVLEPIGPADAALPLAKYIDHEDDHFRKHAAIALGNIGTPECIAPMLKALDDNDDYVRSYAMMGIQRGIEAKRCTKEFLDAMFPSLTKLLNREDLSVSGSAPNLLLAIDTNRAMDVLLSPKFFSVENQKVHEIIRALNAAGHKIPHDTLLPFLKSARPLIENYPHDYAYSEALLAYAHHPDGSTEAVLRSELNLPSGKIQESAAKALVILSGVSDARKAVFDALGSQGFAGLSQPQMHYYSVFIYNAEVNNGGHSQYFVNSSGDHWKSAIEGLKEIGATSRAKILCEAAALFGAAGPCVENAPRNRQLAAFTVQQEKLLDQLDSQYYSCDENVEALLAQYALKNKQHFTARM